MLTFINMVTPIMSSLDRKTIYDLFVFKNVSVFPAPFSINAKVLMKNRISNNKNNSITSLSKHSFL